MKLHIFGWILVLAIGMGCSRSKKVEVDMTDSVSTEAAPRESLVYQGWGTVRGKVTFVGDIPEMKAPDLGEHPHRNHCIEQGLKEESWRINPKNRGVANVVVSLKAPRKSVFPRQPEDRKTWADKIVIDQPHCAFEPRVVVLYPEVLDPESQQMQPTGQQFFVRNTSSLRHDAELEGTNTLNPRFAQNLRPKFEDGSVQQVEFQPKADPQVMTIRCDYHKWMRAYVWAFDHPYATVTNRDGSFEIRNAPAGSKVEIRAWHEEGIVSPAVRPEDNLANPRQRFVVDIPSAGEVTVDFVVKLAK